MIEVTKREWIEWKQNKVTKEYIERIYTKREQLKEGLAEGQAEGTEHDRVIGQCQAIKDAIDYAVFNFETLEEEGAEDAV